MNTLLIVTIAAACTASGVFGVCFVWQWVGGYSTTLKSRLRKLSFEQAPQGTRSIFKQQTEKLWGEVNRRPSITQLIERLIEQSGCESRVRSVVVCSLVCSAGFATVGFLFQGLLAIALAPVGAAMPVVYLVLKRSRRRNQLAKQLPGVLQFLGRAVRAGQTVPSAMNTVSEAFSDPVATEFALCCDQQRLGLSREVSLREMATRSNVMELQIFVVALIVQSRNGGDIVTMLENLGVTLRRRQQFEQRVRCLTSEGRMQAVVLLALPLVSFVGLSYLAPDYIQNLIERPAILVAAFCAQMLGVLWIRSIIRIDV